MSPFRAFGMLAALELCACSAQIDTKLERDVEVVAQDTRTLCALSGALVLLDASAVGLAADASAEIVCAVVKAVPAPGPLLPVVVQVTP